MYNPYDNNNQTQNNAYNSNNSQNYTQPQNTYTWQGEQHPPVASQDSYSSQEPPVPIKYIKKKNKIGAKIAVIALACILSSATTVGIYSFMNPNTTNSQGQNQNDNGLFGDLLDESSIADDSNKDSTNNSNNVDNTSTIDSKALTNKEIAQKVLPSVVCIQNYQPTSSGNFWGTSSQSQVVLASEGSGVILSADGYIVTNAHVVADAENLSVITSEGETYEAKLLGSDEASDIAVIKIEATNLTPAEVGSSSNLQMGDDAIVIGNPGGMTFNSSMTTGCISALDRQIDTSEFGYALNVIQTDAAISPGNSGGALLNRYGQLVGITSSKYVDERFEGIGFALPIDDVMPIVEDLKNHGIVTNRAIIGVSCQYVDQMTANFNGMYPGLYVIELTSDNAKNSGLQQYDIITHADGVAIDSLETLTEVLVGKKPGDTMELTVFRTETKENNIAINVVLSAITVD